MSVKDANLSALMCSYPHVNGVFSCESTALLTDVLRTQWGFKGYMMSDRGATHSTAPSIKAGLDLEFGSNAVWFTPVRVKAALDAGEITTADLDTMLERRYGVMFRLGQFDDPIVGVQDIDFATHGETARTIAEQGAVLLKNANDLLPLKAARVHSIAVIGPKTFAGAAKFPATGPGGFITVNAPYSVTPVAGINNALAQLGGNATVTYNDGTDLTAAASLAASVDVAIVMVGDISLEGQDRPNLSLPMRDNVNQEALIAAVAASNPRTVVVLKNGGPVIMPWLASVPAVLEAWYPGQEDGNAVANLLFGIANPSGKLPISFPAAEGLTAANTTAQFPGVPDNRFPLTATYTEQLEMGYRWYDARGVKPLFAFGYGLSYTSFAISKLEVTPKTSDGTHPILVQFFVENTGKVAGAEVPQVYVGLPSAAGEPPKRLVAFQKLWLAPGEKRRVQVLVDPAATNHPLGIFDSASRQWKTVDGSYSFLVGSSSADIAASSAVTVRTPARR
jgi:beta-glucosidase